MASEPGEIMIFGNFAYQYFDWWHDKVNKDINGDGEITLLDNPSAFLPGEGDIPEDFVHEGLFKNKAINLGFTIGLSSDWNVTLSQLISERCMEWEGPVWESADDDGFDPTYHNIGESKTVHHRTECSSSDFSDGDNQIAFGGILGDTRLNFRYIIKDTQKGKGDKIYLGMGLDIPSSSVITESPWKKSDHDNDSTTPDRYTPHRHFYLSDGAYKMNLELQFFRKRFKFPVFWGGTLSFNFPLNDSKYDFTPSKRYQLSLMAMSGSMAFQKIKLGNLSLSSIGPTLTIGYASRSKWKEKEPDGSFTIVETPNSKSILYVPGINILLSFKNGGGLGINLTRGFERYINENPSDIKEETNIYGISISYRTILDKRIDWLW